MWAAAGGCTSEEPNNEEIALIHQLPEAAYGSVGPLFGPLGENLALSAFLERSAPARIYVDDPGLPRAALIWAGHRFYLAGQPDNEAFNEGVRELFADEVYPEALAAAGRPMFTLQFSPGWEGSPPLILRGKHPMRDERQYLLFRGPQPTRRPPLPPGFALRAVDRQLLAYEGLRNLEALKEEMCSERRSVEDFLEHSFGFCLVHGDEIVSWCLSEYNSRRGCEVGIETVEPYRRQGLATLVASALVEEALRRGLRRVGWDSWASNAASIATARKAGFEKARDYPVHFAWYDEVSNLAVNGNMRLRAHDYEGAIEWFERAFQHGEAPWWAYWGAARAYAMAGRHDAALDAIRQAAAHGLDNLDWVKDAQELRPLHGSSGWKALIEELEGRLAGGRA
jgi:RimJ/RimL family protein N-acetyltransferase